MDADESDREMDTGSCDGFVEIPEYQGKCLPEIHRMFLENEFLFYSRLYEFHKFSEKRLLASVGNTVLNLYDFYREVIIRGGLDQVNKDGSWDEVASALNLRKRFLDPSLILQQHYIDFLYHFEQEFMEGSIFPSDSTIQPEYCSCMESCSTLKRLHRNSHSSSPYFGGKSSHLYAESVSIQFQMKSSKETPNGRSGKVKVSRKKDPHAPKRPRSAYQIFYHQQFSAIKKMNQNFESHSIRNIVVELWKNLSEDDRTEYINESLKDKERYYREMQAYTEHRKEQELENLLVRDVYRPCHPKVAFGGEIEIEERMDEFLSADELTALITLHMMNNTQ